MKHESVTSSAIKSVGHDEESQTMEIKFKSGHVAKYENVTRDEFETLRDAPSVGKHFNEFWRNR